MSQTPERKREYMREYSRTRRADPIRYGRQLILARDRELKRKYSISWEDYIAMFAAQGGECGICGREFKLRECVGGVSFKTVHVDHNHKTGRVRGLLCFTCNSALGKFLDSPQVLLRALSYLERENG